MLKSIKAMILKASEWFMERQNGFMLSLMFVQACGIIFVAIGLYQTKSQIQGSTVQATFQTTKSLIFKALEDPAYHPLLMGGEKLDEGKLKRKYFLGLMVNHYYTIFRQYRLGNIPLAYWHDVEHDLKMFFRNKISKENWKSRKKGFSPDFVKYIDTLYSN